MLQNPIKTFKLNFSKEFQNFETNLKNLEATITLTPTPGPGYFENLLTFPVFIISTLRKQIQSSTFSSMQTHSRVNVVALNE